jgi:hypothetical protein
MDYVLIAAIMTFFILLYVLNIREGYTDSYINSTVDSIKTVKGNIEKNLINIKDLIGTNTGNSNTIDLMNSIGEIQSGISTYKDLNSVSLAAINKEYNNMLVIQNNIISIRKKLKGVLESVNVSIIPLNSTNQVTLSLVDAMNHIKEDLNAVSTNLNQIPDEPVKK